MAQITNRALENNAVSGSKFRLNNAESLRARNAANNADVSLFNLDNSNVWVFQQLPQYSGSNVATEAYVTNAIAGFQNAFVNKGTYDASLNVPALSDGTGTNGWIYRVNVAGTVDLGSGSLILAVGDKLAYNGSVWEKWDVIDDELPNSTTDDLAEGSNNLYYTEARFDSRLATKTTSDLAEGTNLYYTLARFNSAFSGKSTSDLSEGTNLYFTDARAKSAAVVDSTSGNETDQAPSVAAMKAYVNSQSTVGAPYTVTLSATDISNGYILLPTLADHVLDVTPKGFPSQYPTDDYVVDTLGGVTRINFAGDMLLLVANDKVKVTYSV